MLFRHPRKFESINYVLINKCKLPERGGNAYLIELWSCNDKKELIIRYQTYIGYYNPGTDRFTLYPKTFISYAYYYTRQREKQIISAYYVSNETYIDCDKNYIEISEDDDIEEYIGD